MEWTTIAWLVGCLFCLIMGVGWGVSIERGRDSFRKAYRERTDAFVRNSKR